MGWIKNMKAEKHAAWQRKLAQLASESSFFVHIRTLQHGIVMLEVKPSLQVADIKEQVRDIDRIPLSQQRIRNCDRKARGDTRWMKNKDTLREYAVEENCTLIIDRYID